MASSGQRNTDDVAVARLDCDDKLLVELPQWLADENVGYTQGAVPTAFVGRIEAESEEAIHLSDAAATKSLRKLAHRITQLEQSDNADQDDWVDDRLTDHREQFSNRDDAVSLNIEWLPKAEITRVKYPIASLCRTGISSRPNTDFDSWTSISMFHLTEYNAAISRAENHSSGRLALAEQVQISLQSTAAESSSQRTNTCRGGSQLDSAPIPSLFAR